MSSAPDWSKLHGTPACRRTPLAGPGLAVALLLLWTVVACTRDDGLRPTTVAEVSPTPASVDLLVTEREQFYDVSGLSTEDILRSVERSGPTHFGTQASGTTHSSWDLQWAVERSSACRISSMRITLELLVTLPRHSEAAVLEATAPELAANWRRFVEAVRVHEQEHVDIERERARGTRAAMTELANRLLGCDALRAEVDRIWEDGRGRADGLHRAFDEDDRRRIQALRAPINQQIDRLEASIDAADTTLSALDVEIESIDRELASLKERYPDLVLPEPAYSRHGELTTRRSRLVHEYDVALDARNGWADETNVLVDQYNWTN